MKKYDNGNATFAAPDAHDRFLVPASAGFSDNPLDGFSYMLAENAEILDYFVREIE